MTLHRGVIDHVRSGKRKGDLPAALRGFRGYTFVGGVEGMGAGVGTGSEFVFARLLAEFFSHFFDEGLELGSVLPFCQALGQSVDGPRVKRKGT